METIDNYIKEALITKANIENARKANDGEKIVFIPYLTTCGISNYIKHKKEFLSYDDAINYFNTNKSDFLVDFDPNEYRVIDISTTVSGDETKRMIIPKNQQNDWKSFYQLNIKIETKANSNTTNLFVGWTDHSKDEMKEL